jgi:hypothetical protein
MAEHEKKETIFADGMFCKRRDGAPEYVIANISFNVDKFVAFLNQHKDESGWVNTDVMMARSGQSMYGQLDQWKPTPGKEAAQGIAQARETVAQPADSGDFDDSIPFMPYGYREFI